jgi:hypothetical protein
VAAGPAGKFALVLLDEAVPPLGNEIYGELARTIGRVRYDVVAAFKRSPGIPFEDLSEDLAGAAAALFSGAGIPARALGAERLPAPARSFVVHRAELGDGGLAVQIDLAGAMQVLPWERIAGISAATRSESGAPAAAPSGPSIGRMLAGTALTVATGLPIGLGGAPARRAGPAPRAVAHETLAVSAFGADFEVRFRADELGYEFLGERMAGSSAQNFRLFAAALAPRCSRARVSRAAQELASAGAAPPAMEADAFSLHNRWLKLLAGEGI